MLMEMIIVSRFKGLKEWTEAVNSLNESCRRLDMYLAQANQDSKKVWLTIEDAKLAKKCARYVAGYLADDEEARMVWKFADKLSERIEQAEGK